MLAQSVENIDSYSTVSRHPKKNKQSNSTSLAKTTRLKENLFDEGFNSTWHTNLSEGKKKRLNNTREKKYIYLKLVWVSVDEML